MTTKDWSWLSPDGSELRLMQLPDRKALYLVLTDDSGMHCLARTTGDREANALAAWLDTMTGADHADER